MIAPLAATQVSTMTAVVVTILVVAFIAGVIALVMFAAKKERLRREAVVAALAARGLRVAQEGERPVDRAVLEPIEALASRSDETRWSASGEVDGVEFTVLEHEYTSGGGKSRQTHRNSVVSIAIASQWPMLSVTAENFLHRIGERLFGMHDIRVDDDAFNKRFRVKSDDENFAVLFLNPQVQSLMMGWDRLFFLSLSVKGDRLCLHALRHFDEREWLTFLDYAVALRRAIAPELDAWEA